MEAGQAIPLNFSNYSRSADICGIIVAVGSSKVDQSKNWRARHCKNNANRSGKSKKLSPLGLLDLNVMVDLLNLLLFVLQKLLLLILDWTDAEIASIPCAYSTAEGLLHRSQVGEEKVFITGASGGVGSAAVQLAKLRGATIIAQCANEKKDKIKKIGADQIVFRESNLTRGNRKKFCKCCNRSCCGIELETITSIF